MVRPSLQRLRTETLVVECAEGGCDRLDRIRIIGAHRLLESVSKGLTSPGHRAIAYYREHRLRFPFAGLTLGRCALTLEDRRRATGN